MYRTAPVPRRFPNVFTFFFGRSSVKNAKKDEERNSRPCVLPFGTARPPPASDQAVEADVSGVEWGRTDGDGGAASSSSPVPPYV